MKNTATVRYHVKLLATTSDGSFDRATYEVTLSAANACAALGKVLRSTPDCWVLHTIEVCPDV